MSNVPAALTCVIDPFLHRLLPAVCDCHDMQSCLRITVHTTRAPSGRSPAHRWGNNPYMVFHVRRATVRMRAMASFFPTAHDPRTGSQIAPRVSGNGNDWRNTPMGVMQVGIDKDIVRAQAAIESWRVRHLARVSTVPRCGLTTCPTGKRMRPAMYGVASGGGSRGGSTRRRQTATSLTSCHTWRSESGSSPASKSPRRPWQTACRRAAAVRRSR